MMGDGEDDKDGRSFERPQHPVLLTRSILMQTTPVTQSQWEALMGNNPSEHKGADGPVNYVIWFDAVAYCNRLSQRFGIEEAYVLSNVSGKPGELSFLFEPTVRWKGLACAGFRLPTEAEREHACRAGTVKPRYGNLDDITWYEGNGELVPPVGNKKPNAFGLYDMLGNVMEWCWDWDGKYSEDPVTDPVGPDSGSGRMQRGGACGHAANRVRAASRCSQVPPYSSLLDGFRPTRSLA